MVCVCLMCVVCVCGAMVCMYVGYGVCAYDGVCVWVHVCIVGRKSILNGHFQGPLEWPSGIVLPNKLLDFLVLDSVGIFPPYWEVMQTMADRQFSVASFVVTDVNTSQITRICLRPTIGQG
jgi:hypothetical protein